MSLKQELQQLHGQLDKSRRKLAAAEARNDTAIIAQFSADIEATNKKIASLKGRQTDQLSGKAARISALPFHRALSKAEQADQGKLKKSVRGLTVVHPLTALGREMGLKVITGYAPKQF